MDPSQSHQFPRQQQPVGGPDQGLTIRRRGGAEAEAAAVAALPGHALPGSGTASASTSGRLMYLVEACEAASGPQTATPPLTAADRDLSSSPSASSMLGSPTTQAESSSHAHAHAAAVQRNLANTTTPPETPRRMVPATNNDWEGMKPIIHDLYMQQNLSLKDVVDKMCAEHKFKATARMYKTQFNKWGWSKYNSKRLHRNLSSGRAVQKPSGKSCRRPPRSNRTHAVMPSTIPKKARVAHSQAAGTQDGGGPSTAMVRRGPYREDLHAMTRLQHGTNGQFYIERVLCEIQDHVHWFHAQKDEWRFIPGVDLIGVYNYRAYDTFRSAFDHFIRNEHEIGGELLRHAFVQVEEMVQTDTSGSFYGLFVELPDLLLHFKRVDILQILLKHINKLAPIKTRNKSLSHIFLILQSIVNMEPEQLAHYVESASGLWMNMLRQLRGEMDRSTLMAKRNYFRHTRNLDEWRVKQLVGEYEYLRGRAQAMSGGDWNSTLRHLEDITLSIMHNHGVYSRDFVARSENLNARLEAKYEGKDLPKEHWDVLDRNILSNSLDRMATYYRRVGDAARAERCAAKAREGWQHGPTWQFEVESLLSKAGRGDEAEKISWTRLEGVYWMEVQDTLSRQRSPDWTPPIIEEL